MANPVDAAVEECCSRLPVIRARMQFRTRPEPNNAGSDKASAGSRVVTSRANSVVRLTPSLLGHSRQENRSVSPEKQFSVPRGQFAGGGPGHLPSGWHSRK